MTKKDELGKEVTLSDDLLMQIKLINLRGKVWEILGLRGLGVSENFYKVFIKTLPWTLP